MSAPKLLILILSCLGLLQAQDPWGRPLPPREQQRQQAEKLFGKPIPPAVPVRRQSKLPAGAPYLAADAPVAHVLSEQGATVAAAPADLAETPDVQFTPEVRDLVVRLKSDPQQIYLYVKDNFRFTPYLGSQKGSQGALLEQSGNDFDLASLLIAMLRSAGIPARYVFGSMYLSETDAAAWIGVQTAEVARRVLVWQGIPAQLVNTGGGSLLVNRVWVEAQLDGKGPKPRWVPMDPAFKTQSTLPGSLAARQVDFSVPEFTALPPTDGRSGYEFFRDKVQAALDQSSPGTSVADISLARDIVPAALPKGLPRRLDQHVRVAGEAASLADAQRYLITVYTVDAMGVSAQATVALPVVYGRRLTISFPPASAADQDLVRTSGGYYKAPPAQLHVKASIKLDGLALAEAMRSAGIGEGHYIVVDFLPPGAAQPDRVFHTVFAGGYYALALDTVGDAAAALSRRGRIYKSSFFAGLGDPAADYSYSDVGIGEDLMTAGLTYLNNTEREANGISALLWDVPVKDVAEVLAGQDIRFTYTTTGALAFEWWGWHVDAQRMPGSFFSVDGDDSDAYKKLRLDGLSGSYLENRAWEDRTNLDSISAAKGLQVARASGIPILTIDRSNASTLIPTLYLPGVVLSAVQDAVNAGRTVTIPRTMIQYYDWTGSVWSEEAPDGSSAYMIAGGIWGGQTAKDAQKQKKENPTCADMNTALGDDIARAIAFFESRWTQFDPKGRPITSSSGARGVMQLTRSCCGNLKVDGSAFSYSSAAEDWAYNIKAGKALIDTLTAEATRHFRDDLGAQFPLTAEQLLGELYFQYNSGGYYRYRDPGQKKATIYHEFYYSLDENGKIVKDDYSSLPGPVQKYFKDSQGEADHFLEQWPQTPWTSSDPKWKKGCR